MTLWGADSSKPFIITSCFGGLGKLLAPAFALPFITITSLYGNNEHNSLNISFRNNSSTDSYTGHVYQVYVILGCLITGGTVFLACVVIALKPSDCNLNLSVDNVKESHKPVTSTGSRLSVILCCAVFILYFFFIDIVIEGLLNFLYTIATESRYFTRDEASLLNIVIQGISLVSKLVLIALLNCVSIQNLMNILIILSSLSGVIMSIFGLSSNISLWITASIFIFVATPVYSGGFAYANEYVNITGFVAGLFAAAVSLGYFTSAWMTASVLRNYGSRAVLWELTVATMCQSFILIGVRVVSNMQAKLKNKEPLCDERHPLFEDTKEY